MSNNSKAADAEGASVSSKEGVIKGLKEDLAKEYETIIRYVVFSSTLKGDEFGGITDQLIIQEQDHEIDLKDASGLR